MGKKTGMKIGDGDEEEDGEKEEDDPNMGKMRSAGEDTGREIPCLVEEIRAGLVSSGRNWHGRRKKRLKWRWGRRGG